MGAKTPGW